MSDEESIVVRPKTHAPKGAIELPAELPPPVETDDPIGPGPAQEPVVPEVLSKAEERYRASNDEGPPKKVVTRSPMTKETSVVPVEVQADALWGFLEALDRIADDKSTAPILAGIKLTFEPGENPKLLLEATNTCIWAAAGLKAWGGGQGFKAILPRKRAINIVKELRGSYATLMIGMDDERIHIGDFSFPFHGVVDHFPRQPTLEDAAVSVVLPTGQLEDIPLRIYPAVNVSSVSYKGAQHVYLDFENKVAVATDGNRMHLLAIPMMHVEYEQGWKADQPKGVQVPVEVFRYLGAVESRDWTGFRAGPTKVMAGHDDFGLIADTGGGKFPDWKKVVPIWPGEWVVSRELLLEKLQEASFLLEHNTNPGVTLAFDQHSGTVAIASKSAEGDAFETTLEVKANGTVTPFSKTVIDATYLYDAVNACRGTMVRIGIGGKHDPTTYKGEDNAFTAVIMPMRNPE